MADILYNIDGQPRNVFTREVRVVDSSGNVYNLADLLASGIGVPLTLTQGANTTLTVTRTHISGVPVVTTDTLQTGSLVYVGDEITITVAPATGYTAAVDVDGIAQTLTGGVCIYNITAVSDGITIETEATAI